MSHFWATLYVGCMEHIANLFTLTQTHITEPVSTSHDDDDDGDESKMDYFFHEF